MLQAWVWTEPAHRATTSRHRWPPRSWPGAGSAPPRSTTSAGGTGEPTPTRGGERPSTPSTAVPLRRGGGHRALLPRPRRRDRPRGATWKTPAPGPAISPPPGSEQADLSLYHGLAGCRRAHRGRLGARRGAFEEAAVAAADQIVPGGAPVRRRSGLDRRPRPARRRRDHPRPPARRHGCSACPPTRRPRSRRGTGSPSWPCPATASATACADLPQDAVTPGFLSGTAGTAFLLARLYGLHRRRGVS